MLAAVVGAMALGSCLATKYQMAPKDTLPAVALDIATAQPPVALALRAVIVYNGPGSWKRDALWDEYVVTILNQSESALTIDAAALLDPAGEPRVPGSDPWNLEEASQTLEQRYVRAGIAFARSEIPDAVAFGAGAVGSAAGSLFTTASATAATASVVALPVYYVVVYGVDRSNKAAVRKEFTRRRLVLPHALAGGETMTGSLFFPMTPAPRSLNLQWANDFGHGSLVLPLPTLQGLHVAPPGKEPAATAP